ncbi:MAG: hypothetical protein ACRD2J_06345, partial [Thermoanaerobaculia bacterium]
GCATSANRPEEIPEPVIQIRQVAPIFFGSIGTAPVSFDILIGNAARVPLEVREIEISSFGNAQYELLRNTRRLRQTIPARTTEAINIFTTAVNRGGRGTPSEPPSVRVIVTFETTEGERFREIVHDAAVFQ